ncbi:MAG: hypothetical protein JKY09_07890 [Crocinitomicaceae bacterium]|nr:hypothetical protein [Crocinitomicaceae bacterium]
MKNNVISLFGNKKVVQNEGVKYSDLLNDFIESFENDFSGDYEIEDIFGFAIHAWNFGNMSKIMPPEEFKDVVMPPEMPKEENRVLQKMLALKAKKFEEYDRYILDYALEERNDEIILSVVTGGFEDFLESIQKEFSHQTMEEDFKANYINRYAVVLKPQQPFIDWINSLYPDDKITEVKEANIYLVDDSIDDVEKWLKKKYDKFFMMELDEWHKNKKEWPQIRSYKTFKQWFKVDISKMIYDLEKRPIVKEE